MTRSKWTHSSDNDVRACRRKAFYTARFASPTARAGSVRREAAFLKQAIDIPLWRGNLVHKTIERYILPSLKKGEEPNFEFARNMLLKLIGQQAEFSRDGRFRKHSKTAAGDIYCVLRADLNGQGTTKDEIHEVEETSILAINNLETHFSDLLRRAQFGKDPEAEKEIRFALDDRIRIEAILDFIFFEFGKGAVIVDWKAGLNLTTNAREQLYVYAYAVLKCGWWGALTCENIELIEANLMTGDQFNYQVTQDDIDDVDDRIFTGSQILEPIYEHLADECSPEDFEPAQSPGTCEWCVVKEICNGNLQRKTTVQPPLSLEFV